MENYTNWLKEEMKNDNSFFGFWSFAEKAFVQYMFLTNKTCTKEFLADSKRILNF